MSPALGLERRKKFTAPLSTAKDTVGMKQKPNATTPGNIPHCGIEAKDEVHVYTECPLQWDWSKVKNTAPLRTAKDVVQLE